MKIFVLLAAVVIMIVAFMTVGFVNTLIIAASGAGAYWYLTSNKHNGANGYAG